MKKLIKYHLWAEEAFLKKRRLTHHLDQYSPYSNLKEALDHLSTATLNCKHSNIHVGQNVKSLKRRLTSVCK